MYSLFTVLLNNSSSLHPLSFPSQKNGHCSFLCLSIPFVWSGYQSNRDSFDLLTFLYFRFSFFSYDFPSLCRHYHMSQIGFPQKQTLEQKFKCKEFILRQLPLWVTGAQSHWKSGIQCITCQGAIKRNWDTYLPTLSFTLVEKCFLKL